MVGGAGGSPLKPSAQQSGGVRYILFLVLRASDGARNGSRSSPTAPVLLAAHDLAASKPSGGPSWPPRKPSQYARYAALLPNTPLQLASFQPRGPWGHAEVRTVAGPAESLGLGRWDTENDGKGKEDVPDPVPKLTEATREPRLAWPGREGLRRRLDGTG